MWHEYLELGGGELVVSAAGAESVSRAVKMLECANGLQERNKGTEFCVRPRLVREEGEGSDGGIRVSYQFDFYAL